MINCQTEKISKELKKEENNYVKYSENTLKKFIELRCQNCQNLISKKGISEEQIVNFFEKNNYCIKFNFVTCCLRDLKTSMWVSDGRYFLFEGIRCIHCDYKVGIFIYSACSLTKGYLDCFIFSTHKVSKNQIHYEDSKDLNKSIKLIQKNDYMWSLKDKDKICKFISLDLEKSSQIILNIDLFFDKLCEIYNTIRDKTEKIKEHLVQFNNKIKQVQSIKDEENKKSELFENIKSTININRDITKQILNRNEVYNENKREEKDLKRKSSQKYDDENIKENKNPRKTKINK